MSDGETSTNDLSPSDLLRRARELWFEGGAFRDPVDDPPRWDRLPLGKLRVWARGEYDKPGRGARTVVQPREKMDARSADFVTRFFVPLSTTEAEAWLVYGELPFNEDGELIVSSFGVGPYDDRFGTGGFGYDQWQQLRLPQFRAAATAELAKVAGWHDLMARTGWTDPQFDQAAGALATTLAGRPSAEGRRPRRGNPGKAPLDYFDFATRWLLYQRDRHEGGVISQLAEHYKLSEDGVKYRRTRAQRLGFLSSGDAYLVANRRPGPTFATFWQSLEEGDPLKELAGPLLPRKAPTPQATRRPRRPPVASGG